VDQFEFMVDKLTNYKKDFVDGIIKSEEEATNESAALVESTLLHGYTITDGGTYLTKLKRVTERVS